MHELQTAQKIAFQQGLRVSWPHFRSNKPPKQVARVQFCRPCARGGFGLRLPAPASLRRGEPLTQGLATVTRSRGGFDESTPTQGSATAPTCGELCDPPPSSLRGLSPPTLHSAAPVLPPRLPHKLRPPSSCPSNKFASPLLPMIFRSIITMR